jgi:RimJ/RimL family protein N-acetyltransferase
VVRKRGVKRFIAETEKHNVRSSHALEKIGFVLSRAYYWKEPNELE